MRKDDLAIATISWARNPQEEALLRTSLMQLAKLSIPVFLTDGGSSDAFVNDVRALPGFTVLSAKGLWAQVKTSLQAATGAGAQTILYTEPDKKEFFRQHLPRLLQTAERENLEGVVLASRSPAGFASFPAFQQTTEKSINDCCAEVMGKDVDCCYGPFLFPSSLVPFLKPLPEDCGWGWRPFLFASAHRLGYPVETFVGDFTCPPDQRDEDKTERIYRMKQLAQNINGLVLGATIPLPSN